MAQIFDQLTLLSEPIRTRLLMLLEEHELGVGELVKVLQLPQSTVSRHLKKLLDEGWVTRRKERSTSWVSLGAMPAPREALWQVVRAEAAADKAAQEDQRRLEQVLAEREVDSEAYFGRMADQWTAVRAELFGEGFLQQALLLGLAYGKTVADLGCGPGETLALLAPAAAKVIGVDREPLMLEAAAEATAGHGSVELRRGRLEDLPLATGEVDLALMTLVLHHVEDPQQAVVSAAAALAEHGQLLIVDMVAHDREAYRRTMGHRHLGFDVAQVRAWAASAGRELVHYGVLPPAVEASGPGLFAALVG